MAEYQELLEMPETFILYRFFFKWLDDVNSFGPQHWRKCWRKCMVILDEKTKQDVIDIIHSNDFNNDRINQFDDPLIKELFGYYSSHRNDIVDPKSELYKLKQQYDAHPTIALKRKRR